MLDTGRAGIAGGWSRRRFVQGAGVAGLALVAGCGRLPGQAPTVHVPRIGVLNPYDAAASLNDEAFRQGLHDLGYIEGQNILLEYRYAAGDASRVSEITADLLRLPVEILCAFGTPQAVGAKATTSTTPIVAVTGDPVGSGLVASLAHPEGNVTGLSILSPQLSAKRLEILKETLPNTVHVAVLLNGANPTAETQLREVSKAAELLQLTLQPLAVRRPDDFEGALEAARHGGAEGLLTLGDAMLSGHASQITELAAQYHLPTMYSEVDYPPVGGLMAYAPNNSALSRRAAYYVDRILKGTKPADLPIEQPREFEFLINLKTAQALSLTIPQHVLLQATEVIQ